MSEGPRTSPKGSVGERRLKRREPVTLNIRYNEAGSTDISQGMLCDHNMGGAAIRTPQPLPVGKRLILEIASPAGTAARCAAEIRYTSRSADDGYKSGARFIDLDGKDLEALQAILQLKPPPKAGPFPREKPPPAGSLSKISSGLERRKAGRFSIERSVSFKIFDASGRSAEEGVAEIFDLSLTGIGVRTSVPILQGVSLQLEVVYAGGLRCAIEAECIYCRKESNGTFANGLRFTALERADLSFFSKMLAR